MNNLPLTLLSDLRASLVVFLVALPLCLGIALASGAPAESGLIAGVIGGVVVGLVSGSATSVSGPAAGLTAVVAAQLTAFGGSFETFLLAVFLAGLIQIALGVARLGFISAFFPTSVINGLLAAIGLIILTKQWPYLIGYNQGRFHPSVTTIGLASLIVLIVWDRVKVLKNLPVPGSLVVVLLGVVGVVSFSLLGERWAVDKNHLVHVPVASSFQDFGRLLKFPNFHMITQAAVYPAAFTIALIASLETLLNVEAVDKLDPMQRVTPKSRELIAQGLGNALCGLVGGIPVTAVIVRGSVNIYSGARSKLSTIFHGLLLVTCVAIFPNYLNQIPLSCLAAILTMTGFKLASWKLMKSMWNDGWYQFLPFLVTLVAIVTTDLIRGVVFGLLVSLGFILWSHVRRPIRLDRAKHPSGEELHLILANQVSFLNRAALDRTLSQIPAGTRLVIDARETDYIDPDILRLINDYRDTVAPARGVIVSLLGFHPRYGLVRE